MQSLPPPATSAHTARPPSVASAFRISVDVLEGGEGGEGEGPRLLPAAPAPSGRRDVLLCALLSGTAVSTSATGGALVPGQLLLIDSARPVEVTAAGRWAMAVLSLPRAHLLCSEESLSYACRQGYEATVGTASLLHPLLLSLCRTQAVFPYSECAAVRVRNQLADLTTTLVTEAAESATPEREDDLLRAIRSWVNERLSDSTLQPSAIAAGNYVSVRRLHKLFERQNGTVSTWIQQRRLDESRRELGRGDGRQAKVSAVAQRWGFVNAAHFSRAFRTRYAMSPRDWRDLRVSKDGIAPADAAPVRTSD